MSFFEEQGPASGDNTAASTAQDDLARSMNAEAEVGAAPAASLSGVLVSGGELPSMADIESLAATLDRIDQTLADLDQQRPTPLGVKA